MKIRPLHDRLVVSRLDEDTKTAGGIVIPDNAKEKPIRGTVVAVGPGKVLDNGDNRALAVKVNDKVLFGKYSGTEIRLEGKDYLILKEDDVLAVLE